MHVQLSARVADRAIAALAGQQFGVVARAQLLAIGVTRKRIAVRLEAGRLTEIHRGVYLLGALAPRYAHEMAALLACGEVPLVRVDGRMISRSHKQPPRAVLSHRSAAALWELLRHPATPDVCITIPPGRSANRPRIKAHRSTLTGRDVRRRHGMPLTSPPRTVLDMAALLPGTDPAPDADALSPSRLDDLEQLVAQATYRGLVSESELHDQLERNPGKRGNKSLRAVLDLPGGPRRTRSPGERVLLRLLRARGIDGFEVNARVCGWEVDFLWRAERLVVEVDGWDGHSSRVAFERDRRKWATLQANGLTVMPVTSRQVTRDADGVLARLLAARQCRPLR